MLTLMEVVEWQEVAWVEVVEGDEKEEACLEEEIINQIVSIEDPDVPWVGEMPEDPPEDEQQFFTNDPGTKTLEKIKEIVEALPQYFVLLMPSNIHQPMIVVHPPKS